NRPRDGQPLLLPARQLDAALADKSLVPLRELFDELMCVGPARGVQDLRVGGVPPAVGDIVPRRSVEQEDVLLNEGQQIAIAAQAEVANVDAVDEDPPPGRIVE